MRPVYVTAACVLLIQMTVASDSDMPGPTANVESGDFSGPAEKMTAVKAAPIVNLLTSGIKLAKDPLAKSGPPVPLEAAPKKKAPIKVPKTLIHLSIRVPAWSPIQMNVDHTYTVRTLKEILAGRYELSPIKLFYFGRELYNETTVSEAGLVHNSVVLVVPECVGERKFPSKAVIDAPSGIKQRIVKPTQQKNPCNIAGANSSGCPLVTESHPEVVTKAIAQNPTTPRIYQTKIVRM